MISQGFVCRALLALSFACFSLAGVRPALAADYPTHPVHWIVPYPPAGSTDIVARLIGQWLSEHFHQQFIIENKPGAGNNIGTEAAVRAAPDGYTLLLVNPANAINTTLYQHLNFNFLRDIAPVVGIIRVPNVMEVNPSVPVKTVAEFIAYAKARPGKINMASSGNGTSIHLSGELFMKLTGVKLVHVPYRGSGPAVTDMVAGVDQVMFDNLPSSIGHIRGGTLRPLAVTTSTPSDALPGVPTIAATVPGYEASAWFGAGVPKGTPPEVIATLNKAINEALEDPKIKVRLTELGGIRIGGTPEAFGALLKSETEKWANVVKFAGASIK